MTRRSPFGFLFYLSTVFIPIFFLSGCGSIQTVSQEEISAITTPQAELIQGNKGWWQAGIGVKFEKGTEPQWKVDLFLAHSIMAPIINKYRENIPLWRFHRRAGQDESGHRFSLIFYSSQKTAGKIFKEIVTSSLLEKARAEGFIVNEDYDDTSEVKLPAINATSDPDWSIITQKAWPYYIMGVSHMWLTMIDDIIIDNPPSAQMTTLKELIDYYGEVDEVILLLWRDEAQHAFLHHLNAIFGYEPMLYIEPKLIRF